MSKKNCKKHEMSKNAGKQEKHICNCKHSRMPLLSELFPGVTLNVKNLHLDEHMESTNFYRNGCCCDKEDSVVIDLDEMAEKIAEQTGIDKATIHKVLAAEDEYLTELGVCEIVDAAEVLDEEDADEPIEKQDEPAESEVENDEQ